METWLKISRLFLFKRHAQVNQEYKEINEQLEIARKELLSAKATFDKVKQKRSHTFAKYFDGVSSKVNEIYRDLTDNPGVNACLSCENETEPYLSGITYSCFAPGKRFTYLSNLSGGEKTLATLALIFSLNPDLGHDSDHEDNNNLEAEESKNLPSLFILDEVDAALDLDNIDKLSKFIARKNASSDSQFLVISLKLDLYHHADVLFGIYKSNHCTKIVSLDMSKYNT